MSGGLGQAQPCGGSRYFAFFASATAARSHARRFSATARLSKSDVWWRTLIPSRCASGTSVFHSAVNHASFGGISGGCRRLCPVGARAGGASSVRSSSLVLQSREDAPNNLDAGAGRPEPSGWVNGLDPHLGNPSRAAPEAHDGLHTKQDVSCSLGLGGRMTPFPQSHGVRDPSKIGAPVRRTRRRVTPPWVWWAATAAAFVLFGLALVLAPRLVGLYWLYWGSGFFEKLFYEDLSLPQAWSSALAVVASFLYALASVYLLGWTAWRALALKAGPREVATAFASYVFIYAAPHVAHGAADAWLNPGVCFNQRTGAPIKWYVVLSGGRVILHDSGGFDKFGNQKEPVTQEICEVFDQQSTGRWPRQLSQDSRAVEFYNPSTGDPLVWYSRGRGGTLKLFDSPGFDPQTSQLLKPVTAEIVGEAQAAAERVASDVAAQRSKRDPRRISVDPAQVDYFDRASGDPKVWYSESVDGTINLFDSPGFDPSTGEALSPITLDVVKKVRSRSPEAEQRPVAPPKLITSNPGDVQYFDPATGDPAVWYSKGAGGQIRLFDRKGFDPATGVALKPITQGVAEMVRTAGDRAADTFQPATPRDENREYSNAAPIVLTPPRAAAPQERIAAEPAFTTYVDPELQSYLDEQLRASGGRIIRCGSSTYADFNSGPAAPGCQIEQ